MMSMLEPYKKGGNNFKESIDIFMYLHNSVKVNKIETLNKLYNELVEKKILGHEFFMNLDDLSSRRTNISQK